MDSEQLRESIAAGERRRVEFKRAAPLTDSQTVARVARAVLAMTNTRDGGRIIIGVEEKDGKPLAVGVSPADLPSWKFDDLAAKIGPYADPSVTFTMSTVELDGMAFILLDVMDFDEVPVICRKGYDGAGGTRVLRAGAIYVRGRPKPESIEVSNQTDMRELIDFATEKQLALFVRESLAAGTLTIPEVQRKPDDAVLFAREREQFLG
jgi:predicted HTH transcriptional regulator